MSAYISKPGLEKRVYSGALYYCERCNAQVSGQSPNEHYRNCHQPKVNVRFGTSNRATIVQRSPQTGLFHCPRCPAAFRHPRSMQDHGLAFSKDKCAKGMPKHRVLSGSSGPVTPARREQTASTPKSARKSASRPRKSTYKEGSSPKSTRRTAARPLAVPTRTRTGIPDVSRTTRALIRQSWKTKEYSNKEIAEFYQCDVRDVYFAINNEAEDNLEEDADYVSGKRGEVIDVDALPDAYEDREWDEMESGEVDLKLEEEFTLYEREYSDDGGGSDDEVDREYMHLFGSPEAESSQGWHEGESPFPEVPPTPSDSSRHPSLASVPPPEDSMQVDEEDPIVTFLSTLRRSNAEMLDAFKTYGVRTAEDLDVLCEMRDYWGEVEPFFLSRGITAFQWLLIRDGLIARASRRSR